MLLYSIPPAGAPPFLHKPN